MANISLLLILCAALYVAHGALAAQDACAIPSAAIPPSHRYKCYQSIRSDRDWVVRTVRAVRFAMNMYPFIDLVRDPPKPFDSQSVLIMEELAAIESAALSGTFPSDFGFQRAIAKLLMKLRDGHTSFRIPMPYINVTSCLPVEFLPVEESDRVMVKITSLSACYARMASTDEDWTWLLQREIVAIEGMPPFQYLVQLGLDNDPKSKDDGPLVNQMLLSLGEWTAPHAPPINDTLNITLDDGNQVQLPWLTQSRAYNNSEEFMLALLHDGDSESSLPHFDVPDVASLSIKSAAAANSWWYGVYRGDTAVIRGNIFGFLPLTPNGLKNLSAVFRDAAQGSRDMGLENVVVDLRGNGGGLDCMAWGLCAYLIEEYDIPATELMEPHDVRVSATTLKTRSRSPVFDEWFLYEDGGTTGNSTGWFVPGVTKERGGIVHQYTEFIQPGCGLPSDLLNVYDELRSSSLGHHFSNILIIGDGLCGSSCAVFSRFLALNGKASTLAVGGLPDVAMQWSAYPGGSATKWSSSAKLFPRAVLPTSSDIDLIITEQYLTDLDTPADFMYVPAEHRLHYWGTDESVIYEQARKLLQTA